METQNQNQLDLTGKFEKLLQDSKNEILQNTVKTKDALLAKIEQYKEVKIENLDSISAYKQIVKGLKDFKKVRTSIDKNRKDLTAPATTYGKELISFAKELIDPILEIESHLSIQKKKFDDLEEAEKNRLFTERAQKLAENGFQLVGTHYICGIFQVLADDLSTMDEKNFTYYLEQGKAELRRKEAEKKRLEELEEREARLKEREARLNELEAKLNAEKNEIAEQSEALEQTYKTAEQNASSEQNEPVKENKEGVLPENKSVSPEKQETASETQKTDPPQKTTDKKSIGGLGLGGPNKVMYTKGFNDCRDKVLGILNNPESFDKKIAVLKRKIIEL